MKTEKELREDLRRYGEDILGLTPGEVEGVILAWVIAAQALRERLSLKDVERDLERVARGMVPMQVNALDTFVART